MSHKGIYQRQNSPPHWDFADSVQAITFRLADSLPKEVIESWKKELEAVLSNPDSTISLKAQIDLHRRIALYEDAGHGSCLLANPEVAKIIQASFISNHGVTYKLIEWTIMPNHIHILIRLLNETPLGSIIQKWKGGSSIQINNLLQRTGPLWAADYHDRYIRDHDHLQNAIAYIRNNPVKARLCEKPTDWPHSSAGQNWSPDFSPALPTPRPD
jgi:REP element-mobilizing transposase RayT